jgi:hypothetical protein
MYVRHTIIARLPRHTGKTTVPVFLTVRWDGVRLSMTAVEGPTRSGNCYGSCGQCQPGPDYTAIPGVDLKRIGAVWGRWHLNDMKPGTPAQMAALEDMPPAVYPENHYTKACAWLEARGLLVDGGYKYGSAWLKEEVPADVIEFLQTLPDDGDKMPGVWAKE